MTIEEFMAELELRPQDMALITSSGALRIVTPDEVEWCFCPVTYVCYKHTGKVIATFRPSLAATMVGLTAEQGLDLARVADSTGYAPELYAQMKQRLQPVKFEAGYQEMRRTWKTQLT
jgi:hypothetical protein